MTNLLIFGASGAVGSALIRRLEADKKYTVYGTYLNNRPPLPRNRCFRLELDDFPALERLWNRVRPDVVLLALRGDYEKQLRFHKAVAELARGTPCDVWFCSTSAVFDGSTQRPHTEDEAPVPESEYGRFKATCEETMASILGSRLRILRFPAIFGKGVPRVTQLLDRLKRGETVEYHDNFFANRNTDEMLARQIAFLLHHRPEGIFHLGSVDVMGQAGFYRELVHRLGYSKDRVRPISHPSDRVVAVLSKQDWPEELRITHEEILDHFAP
jgi:dTDP-4-dehydrorhamnose reductase